MKRVLVLLLAALLVAGFAAAPEAADYDRYDRYDRPVSPPPREGYAAPPRHAMHGQPYMSIQLGMFEPNDASDGLAGYDTGSAFSMAFGSRVSPFFAFEGTFGAYGADGPGGSDVRVAPVTIGGRFIIPHPFIEPYFTGGFGFYFARLNEPPSGIDDHDATFGGYLGGGVDAWLSNRVALNFEGKYQMATPTFTNSLGNSVDVDVSGWIVNLGVRITFGGGAY